MNKLVGKTKIELFDGLTGKLNERIEEKNMVTNAVSKLINAAMPCYGYGIGGVNDLTVNNAVNNLFGGLLLFDSAITENANNIYPPAGVNLTGCAVRGNTTAYQALPQLGVYVTAESTSSDHARSWVYEFGTTQGNGDIACVCLTHLNGGWAGCGVANPIAMSYNKKINLSYILSHSKLGKNDDYQRYYGYYNIGECADVCIDFDNKEKYMVVISATGVRVIKHKIYPENISVFRNVFEYQPYTEVDNISGTYTGAQFYLSYNSDEKKLYFFTVNNTQGSVTNSVSIPIYCYDMTLGTVSSVGTWSSTVRNNRVIDIRNFVVNNGKLYFTAADLLCAYSFSTGNTTQLTIPSGVSASGTTNPRTAYVLNGLVYFTEKMKVSTSSVDLIVDTSDDSVRVSPNALRYTARSELPDSNRYGNLVPPYDNSQVMFGCGIRNNYDSSGSYGVNIMGNRSLVNTFGVTNYLATINNLSSVVTKTSSKSMKVTYALEEVEE